MTIARRGARTLAPLLVLLLLAVPALATESESDSDQQQAATAAAPAAEKKDVAAPKEKKAGDDEAGSKVCRPSPAKVNTLEELRAGDAKRFDAALNPASTTPPAPQPATPEKKDAPDDDPR